MPRLVIVPLYAAGLGVLFLVLSVRVILARRAAGLRFGFGGDPDLERRVRAHGNFAEYAPFALLLLAMAEARGASAPWLHGLCTLLAAGRLVHAVGLSWARADNLGRVVGMAATQAAILGAIILIVG